MRSKVDSSRTTTLRAAPFAIAESEMTKSGDGKMMHGNGRKTSLSGESKNSIDPRVRIVMLFLDDNFQQHLRLDQMADKVGLSASRLCHLFRSEIGVSPERYLVNTRLTAAQHYLENTFCSVKEIASLVGIPDVSHFTRTFKSTVGTTPTQYRKSILSLRLSQSISTATLGQ